MSLLPYVLLLVVVLAAGGAVLLKRPEWALGLLCLATPIGLEYVGQAQVITIMAILVIAVMIGSRWAAGESPLPGNAFTTVALLWCVTVVLSVVFSPYLADTALYGVWLIVSALLAISVTGIVQSRDSLRPVVICWLLGAIAVTVAGRVIAPEGLTPTTAEGQYGGAVITGRATSIFGQPNEYGTYCMIMFLIALGIAVRSRDWVRWLGVATMGFTFVGLIQSYSRGAWIGWLLGTVVLLVIEPRSRRPILVIGAVAFVAAGAFVAFDPTNPTVDLVTGRLATINDPAANPNDYRSVLVAEGVRQFGQDPWFGVGPNAYSLEGATSRSLESTVGGVHPHNVILTVAAEQGLFGLAALLAMAGVLIVTAFPVIPVVAARLAPLRERSLDWVTGLLAGCLAALCGMLVEGMVDAPLRNAVMRTTVWLVVGMTMATALILRRDAEQGGSPKDGGEAGHPVATSAAVTRTE